MPKSQWAIRIYATRSNIMQGGAIHSTLAKLDPSAKIDLYKKQIIINGVKIQCFTHDMDLGQTEGANLQLILSDEPMYEKIFNAATVRLRHPAGPNIYILFGTPVQTKHGYLMDYSGAQGYLWIKGSMYENNYLPIDYIKRIEKMCEINPDERNARLFGEFASLVGQVFKTFNKKEHVVVALPEENEKYNWYLSIDPHNKKQCFAVLLAVDSQNQVYVVDNYPKEPWNQITSSALSIKKQVENILFMVAKYTNKKLSGIYGDKIFFHTTFNTADGQTNLFNEYRKAGLTVDTNCVTMDWQFRKDRIFEYLYYSEEEFPAIRFLPEANNVITALERFSYKNTATTVAASFNTIVEEEWECPISALSFALTVNLKPFSAVAASSSSYTGILTEKRNRNSYCGNLA
jgi:hypothetical protein